MRVWTGGKAQKRQGIWKNIIFRLSDHPVYVHFQGMEEIVHFCFRKEEKN